MSVTQNPLSNLSPAFRPVDLDGEGFATPPLRALKPRPSGRGGACSGLKAWVSNRIGIRMNSFSRTLGGTAQKSAASYSTLVP